MAGDGYRFRIPKGINQQTDEMWDLSFPGLSESDADELEDLIASIKGIDYLRWLPLIGRHYLIGRCSKPQKTIISGTELCTVSFEFRKEYQEVITDAIPVSGSPYTVSGQGIVIPISQDGVTYPNPGRFFVFRAPDVAYTGYSCSFDMTAPAFYFNRIVVSAGTYVGNSNPSLETMPANQIKVIFGFAGLSTITILDSDDNQLHVASALGSGITTINLDPYENLDPIRTAYKVRLGCLAAVNANQRSFATLTFLGRNMSALTGGS